MTIKYGGCPGRVSYIGLYHVKEEVTAEKEAVDETKAEKRQNQNS